MSEPITLYRDGAIVTVHAPSVARELQAAGWVTEPVTGLRMSQDFRSWMADMERQAQDALADSGEVPFGFRDVEPEPETDVDIVPVKAKRGRPKKVAQ